MSKILNFDNLSIQSQTADQFSEFLFSKHLFIQSAYLNYLLKNYPLFSETCNCPETLQVVAHPSSFDANGQPTLRKMMEELVLEACGECHTHENKKTRLISGLGDDCDLKFPIVQSGDSAQEATGTKFVAVLDVPGLVVLRRKVETELGLYEKVMANSVVNSWPICAIFGVMTLAAALQIWLLVRKSIIC